MYYKKVKQRISYNKAKEILNNNGIMYSNLFDINFVINNTTNATIKNACLRVKTFIYNGK